MSPTPQELFPVVTVSQLTAQIKELLDASFASVWVSGEVINCKPASSGHVYFTLTDSQATLSAVVFKYQARFMLTSPYSLKNGDRVTCHGRIDLYEPHGAYKLVVDQLKSDGLGDLLQRLEELKRKLLAEGLFDPERKVALPRYPRCVGLVTGGKSAAVEDMKRILLERWPCHVKVYPALVQGDQAAADVVRGIALLDADPEVEVIIVGRGGGAFEELLPFSDERVVRAVAQCVTPIVSAVGHEVDNPLCDLAADVRAPTPTAAAQMVVPDQAEIRAGLEGVREKLDLLVDRRLSRCTEQVTDLRNRLDSGSDRLLEQRHRVLLTLENRLTAQHPRRRLDAMQQQVANLRTRMEEALAFGMERRTQHLAQLGRLLETLGPTSMMKRGYSLVRTAQGVPITSVDQVQAGDSVDVVMADGVLGTAVQRISKQTP